MKESNFNRTLVEIYCSDFLDALEKNPNFTDPDRGGTTMKLINFMFVSGLKSDLFRQNIERHGTEDTSSTFKAITKLLPQFQKSINMGFQLPTVQQNQKPPTSAQKSSFTEVAKTIFCENCSGPGHKYRACPFKAECKQCKTKSHADWSTTTPQYPLFTSWKAAHTSSRLTLCPAVSWQHQWILPWN